MPRWHFQPVHLVARLFEDSQQPAEASFKQRARPVVIAHVDLRCDGSAYISATMSRQDDGATPPRVWRDLARQLKAAWGVAVLDWEHKGKDSSREADRAGDWVDTVVER